MKYLAWNGLTCGIAVVSTLVYLSSVLKWYKANFHYNELQFKPEICIILANYNFGTNTDLNWHFRSSNKERAARDPLQYCINSNSITLFYNVACMSSMSSVCIRVELSNQEAILYYLYERMKCRQIARRLATFCTSFVRIYGHRFFILVFRHLQFL